MTGIVTAIDRGMRTMKYIIIGLLAANTAFASGSVVVKAPKKGSIVVKASTLKVIYKAAKRFGVDAQILIKIAFIESSFRADVTQSNGETVDYGMFQINSVHWSTNCKRFDVFSLKGNALCAAKLLSIAAKHSESDLHWQGRYHSKTPDLKRAYADKISKVMVVNK